MKVTIYVKNKLKLIIRKVIFLFLSIWSYMPIVAGILIPMIVTLPLAYCSWIIFSFPLGGVWFDVWIVISPYQPLRFVLVLLIELILFVGGIFLLLLGLFHLVKGRKHGVSIVKTGPYRYIRHPQNFGILLISLVFALYIPRFNDLGIRIGEILSWILFSFILAIYSNLEEYNLTKKFPEEYKTYQLQTGFFLPKLRLRKKSTPIGIEFVTNRKRFLFLILAYFISIFIIFILTQVLWDVGLLSIFL